MAGTNESHVSSPGSSQDIEKLGKLIKGIKFAMLSTATPAGTIHSRPMATQNTEFDGTLWFFTYADSGKTLEIHTDSHVNVSYADPSANCYVSVSGRASVVRDKAKARELWTELHRAWFPDGLDDPNLALLRVDVTEAEYWDAPGSKMVQLVGFVKALVTGKSAEDLAENRKIHLGQ
jgi:general stress protein 26